MTGELFELAAALVPVDRHERQDEVRLLELNAFGVGAHKDVCDLLLVGARVQLEHLEAEIAKIADPVDALLQTIRLVAPAAVAVIEPGAAVLSQTLEGTLEPSTCICRPRAP